MLNNHSEYQIMHHVEQQLWWYKILHEKVLKTIQLKFGENKNINILDAGCGTGGLINFLKNNGYNHIQGFDYSIDAVDFCIKRNLSVKHISILDINNHFDDNLFDVIVNNDVLYQFENHQIVNIIDNLQKKLNQNGILISNNNAFNIFYGTHDIAVGGKQRFILSDFKGFIKNLSLSITYNTYWGFFLSPLILSIRLFQRIKIKLRLIDVNNVKSDLNLPSNLTNNCLYNITKMEERLSKHYCFGSSLYIVMKKN